MNYLQLCQRVAQESGKIAGVTPTAETGQVGRLKVVVDQVASAWRFVQNHHGDSWRWMRSTFSSNTTSGSACYTAASFGLTEHAKWITERGSLSIYLTSTGVSDEGALTAEDWQVWHQTYNKGSQTNGRPTMYAVSNANELCFGPIPDDDYTVNGEYMKAAVTLAANTDTPACPARFHEIIVWRALMFLHQYDEAPTVPYQQCVINYNEYMARLEIDQLPLKANASAAGPLA